MDLREDIVIQIMLQVHRTDSQDSVGSCSSLTNREGLTTLSKIEQIMQQVIQTNMEIHQLKKVTTSTHSSDTKINSGMSTYVISTVHSVAVWVLA